jgi:CRISPR-associated exonuclease Cas4
MDDDAIVMISALQHYIFCPRQFALIHLEQVWDENIYTLRGQRVHEKVNVPDSDRVEDVRIERALPLWSQSLGLRGVADVVEFTVDGTPYPIEYKAGRKKSRLADSVQLCAQALCLEEMLNRSVPMGAIYQAASRQRREVPIDQQLRDKTQQAILAVRQILQSRQLPPAVYDARCADCSLIDACMPQALQNFPRSSHQNNPFIFD